MNRSAQPGRLNGTNCNTLSRWKEVSTLSAFSPVSRWEPAGLDAATAFERDQAPRPAASGGARAGDLRIRPGGAVLVTAAKTNDNLPSGPLAGRLRHKGRLPAWRALHRRRRLRGRSRRRIWLSFSKTTDIMWRSVPMKRPRHQRRKPHVRRVVEPPADVDRADVAARATYIGSPKHKDMPSAAGPVPRPRPDASICPRELTRDPERVERWLRDAISMGNVGSWEGTFPSPVWHKEGAVTYEAHLTRPNVGEYHGYPLEPHEEVEGLHDTTEN